MILSCFSGVRCGLHEARLAAALFLEPEEAGELAIEEGSKRRIDALLLFLKKLPLRHARELCLAELEIC